MKGFFKRFFSQKREVNYLYFSFFLLFLTGMIVAFYRELPFGKAPLFFLLYAIGQAFLEVSIFVLIAYVLKRWTPLWIQLLFIGASFFFLLLHYTNFIMLRLVDSSVTFVFKFLFGGGIAHLIAGFQSLNMNGTMIAMIFAALIGIPLAGLGFFWLLQRLEGRKPLHLSLNQIGVTVCILGATLLLLDIAAHPFLNRRTYAKYQKTLPLGTTFLSPTPAHISLSSPLPPYRNEDECLKHIPEITVRRLPNIYFFVIETLRKDFLDAAPNLTQFGEKNIHFKSSFANANATQLSWFALFHADVPFHWTSIRDNWKGGSIPLRMLKKLGYKIHVYSSSDLEYFGMDKLLFGQNREIADSIEDYTSLRSIQPCDRDALAFKSLEKNLETKGQVHLIFLDSTHSEYSFPKDFPLKYLPISKEIDYLTIGPKSPELEHIKNRYRNAIQYIDSLIGNFFIQLKQRGLFDDAIISITGDHGEEFFEEGALFHGTHLNSYQTSVPIFLKVPSVDWTAQTEQATHIDLFPSILHYLTKQSHFPALFSGQSIFTPHSTPYRVAVHQNGTHPPDEFSFETETFRLRARVKEPSKLEIIELQGSLETDTLLPLLKTF
jgi:hypothetical protein